MTACYDKSHTLRPENQFSLEGPELGLAVYRSGSTSRFSVGGGSPVAVRVVERSYVWAPEQHNPDGTHGYRHYDWSVIEYGPGKRIVVNDTDLSPINLGDIVSPPYKGNA
jgi:hypothetical protein